MPVPTRHGQSFSADRGFARICARSFLVGLAAATCMVAGPGASSAAAQKLSNNLAPEVVGGARVGERLAGSGRRWSGAVSEFKRKWLRDAVPVSSWETYQVTLADKGHSLWCVVTASGSEGTAEAESSNSLAIPGGKAE